MTPEQRQQVLQAAERQREILQCQVVSSEVQKRMKDVQVHSLACVFFVSPVFLLDAAVRCKQSRPFLLSPAPPCSRRTGGDCIRRCLCHFKSRQRSFSYDASRLQVRNPYDAGAVCCF